MESGSYNLDIAKNLQRSLIIMDEVDGMSSGDRGGIMAIIQLIKNAKVPIICICNDRSSEKIRSLANHCLDVRFHKPVKGIMIKRLKDILSMEGGTGEDRALEVLVENFNNDMRQILSYLELIFKTVSPHITLDALSSRSKHAKDSSVMISHFNAARILLNRTEFRGLRITERTDLFFVDSDLVPLIVHENLLASRKGPLNLKQLRSLAQGLKGMVLGDMLDRNIRKEQEWGLMPSFGFMTCVYPTEKIS
jgi:replication factor C subunit 1